MRTVSYSFLISPRSAPRRLLFTLITRDAAVGCRFQEKLDHLVRLWEHVYSLLWLVHVLTVDNAAATKPRKLAPRDRLRRHRPGDRPAHHLRDGVKSALLDRRYCY